jgi:predicted metal-dependent peptidase
MSTPIERWRLVLGESSQPNLGDLSESGQRIDTALTWLYERDGKGGTSAKDRMADRSGTLDASNLSVPDWINEIHELFPTEAIERMERDAIETYGIDDLVTNAEVLERIEPNEALLKAVLQTKHLMNPEVLALARKLVAKVVEQLLEKFRTEIRVSFSGVLDRRRRTSLASAANLDLKRTLAKSLKNYDAEHHRVTVERPQFFARTKRHTEQWQVIVLVDQSGSMVDSVIHSAVTASCLWGIPGLKTHLVAFDTEVVDLTSDVDDPVELLMKVQLGGGTDIAKAVLYGAQLVETPRRTIVVLVSDFYEGGSEETLVQSIAGLVTSGCTVLGLAALDSQSRAAYDRDMAQRLTNVGASVGAMTPGQLASFIAEHVGR